MASAPDGDKREDPAVVGGLQEPARGEEGADDAGDDPGVARRRDRGLARSLIQVAACVCPIGHASHCAHCRIVADRAIEICEAYLL